MQTEIKQTWFFQAPPKEVWEYLTNSDLLELWLMKNDFQPVLGHKFHFMSPSNVEHHCEVLELAPYTRLSYSWQRNSSTDKLPFDSTVVWTLVPKDNGTELELRHHGFRAFEDLAQHDKGWNMLVNALVNRVNAAQDANTKA